MFRYNKLYGFENHSIAKIVKKLSFIESTLELFPKSWFCTSIDKLWFIMVLDTTTFKQSLVANVLAALA